MTLDRLCRGSNLTLSDLRLALERPYVSIVLLGAVPAAGRSNQQIAAELFISRRVRPARTSRTCSRS